MSFQIFGLFLSDAQQVAATECALVYLANPFDTCDLLWIASHDMNHPCI